MTSGLIDVLRGGLGRRALVLSGAGMSTESGLPDYRGENGAYAMGHKPTLMHEFVGSPDARRRYWFRNFCGFPFFSSRAPNRGHAALAALQARGAVGRVITQNVDRLHQAAGTRHVLELHGSNFEVECLSCAARELRTDFQNRMECANADLLDAIAMHPAPGEGGAAFRPDGDAAVISPLWERFIVPPCRSCEHGIVKPRVVFFGGRLEPHVKDTARDWVDAADALIVLGSSMETASALLLARRAKTRNIPIFCVNIGSTRIDDISYRFNDSISNVLLQLLND